MVEAAYVARTGPNLEQSAAEWVRREGYRALAPKIDEDKEDRLGRVYTRRVPLFPCYIFVYFDAMDKSRQWQNIGRLPSVNGLLGGHNPLPLPDKIIAAIERRIEKDADGEDFVKREEMAEGAVIRVTSGPWAGYNGFFQRRSKDRVVALLSVFGQATPVELGAHQVVLVS